jgi:1-acyl-sn-glycerol-3-phosphate acyltransferase
MFWPWGARDWRWAPHLLAGQFWTRTPFRRTLSWWLSNLALVRGEGEQQVAFERVAELMAVPGPRVVGMFPTGPIGQTAHVPPRPGIAYLAMRCPEVPVLPVSLVGLRAIRLRDVLALRRPILTIAVGAPFKASDLSSSGGSVARIVGRIDQTWRELEAQNS